MIYLFRETWKYAREDRWKIVLFMILHGISNCGLLVQPYAFGKAINSIQLNGLEKLEETQRWFIVYIIGFFVFQVFHHSARYFEITTAHRSRNRFINSMYEMVSRLPMKWQIDNHTGETVNRIILAGNTVRDVGFSYYEYLEKLFLGLGPMIILLGISPEITLICLLLMGTNLFVTEKLNKLIAPILTRINESSHEYTGKLIDFIGNIRTVITLNIMNDTKSDLDHKFQKYYRNVMREFKINQPRCFLIGFGSIFTQMIIIIFYLLKCKYSGDMIMIGTFTIIINYFNDMSNAFSSIVSNFYEVLGWKANLMSVDHIIEEYEKGKCYEDEEVADIQKWDEFKIRNLHFGYNEDSGVLNGINLNIKRGEKIAVVGASGSGKSTLINILGGLYNPDELRVWVDGIEENSLCGLVKKSLYVSQEVEIFDNTLEYNITFGMKHEKEELNRAMNIAMLDELISKLPNGIHTDIREKGLNFSGGEKQRLALARGLFFSKNKEILLLDEVTSNVDSINERNIFKGIIENYKDKTVLANVHSLNILDMFDRVIVLEEGEILQSGTFKELLNKNGRLRELWAEYLSNSN